MCVTIRTRSGREVVASGSAFNIKAKSLRLGDFTENEVEALLGQHTADTGQLFTAGAVQAVWNQTRGQPWLVNELAREMCFAPDGTLRHPNRAIEVRDVFEAREELVLRRDTHIDQLVDKLREPQVRRVIEPLLARGEGGYSDADRDYVRDLGLVAAAPPCAWQAPIYGEVLPRLLTAVLQEEMPEQRTACYVNADGGLNMDRLLAAFQGFFGQNSEHWIERARYKKAGPQLVLQAFLRRVVNGEGPDRAGACAGKPPGWIYW